MLILFHCIGLLIFQLLRYRKRIKFLQELQEKSVEKCEIDPKVDAEHVFKFDPPVYRQRYGELYSILIDERWRSQIRKLVDFGCAELKLMVFLKQLRTLNEILFVDIDEDLLERWGNVTRPLTIDFLRRRSQPLEVFILLGSVADPDYRLQNTDVVTAIELIEHLYPDVLEAFPYNIFSYIEPKLVIITTPNADFNVLFSKDSSRFRHYDHKFEWSREQFEDWGNNIITRFPDYTVKFYGIGDGPKGTEHLGQCSQIALFVRKDLLDNAYISKSYKISCICDDKSSCKGGGNILCYCVCPMCSPYFSYGVCTYLSHSKQIMLYEMGDQNNDRKETIDYGIYYKEIRKEEFPFEVDDRTEEEIIMDEIRYRINTFGRICGRFYIDDKSRSEIPVKDLLYGNEIVVMTESELIKLLIKHQYKIEQCPCPMNGEINTCVIHEPEMEETSSISDDSDYLNDVPENCFEYQDSASDWDAPCSHVDNSNNGWNVPSSKSPSDWDWDEVHKKDESPAKCNSSNMDPAEEYRDAETEEETPRDAEAEEELSGGSDKEDDKKHEEGLFDSGYQKSSSLPDDSPETPVTPLEDMEETDYFEETSSNTPSLSSTDNKVQLKRAVVVDRSQIPLPMTSPLHNTAVKCKIDLNRINELDKYHNMPPGRTFMNHLLRPQPDLLRKMSKEPVPGPSKLPPPKRRKRTKRPTTPTENDEDSSSYDDVKSITNCLIKNTLNKLIVADSPDDGKDDLIEFNNKADEPQREQPQNEIPDEKEGEEEDGPKDQAEHDVLAVEGQEHMDVENGDLANNNRDNEGNNYIANIAEDNIGHDIANDNLEIVEGDLQPDQAENVNIDNNNYNAENLQAIEDPAIIFEEAANIENAENDQQINDESSDVARASREALVDPNSEQSLLEDFEIPVPMEEVGPAGGNIVGIEIGSDIMLIGVLPTQEHNDEHEGNDTHGFPHWLLQILGAHVVAAEETNPQGSAQEPHYFCQGDGLGVHPSVIVEVEDEDDTTDSSNNTAEFEDVEQGPSTQDVSSISVDAVIGGDATTSEDTNTATLDAVNVEIISTESQQLNAGSSSESGIGSSKDP